jgi:molecular chaperone IbpA
MATTFDYSPLFRSSIGFDRVLNLLENASKLQSVKTWPPYDIVRTSDDSYQIVLAVPGFGETDIEMTYQPNLLIIAGRKVTSDNVDYLHRGIGKDAFEHRFELAEHVKVASARLENGLLSVELKREVPEAMRPRRISINEAGTLANGQQMHIEEQKAA